MASESAANTVLVERKDRVAWVTISRPEVHNALDGHTIRELEAARGKRSSRIFLGTSRERAAWTIGVC